MSAPRSPLPARLAGALRGGVPGPARGAAADARRPVRHRPRRDRCPAPSAGRRPRSRRRSPTTIAAVARRLADRGDARRASGSRRSATHDAAPIATTVDGAYRDGIGCASRAASRRRPDRAGLRRPPHRAAARRPVAGPPRSPRCRCSLLFGLGPWLWPLAACVAIDVHRDRCPRRPRRGTWPLAASIAIVVGSPGRRRDRGRWAVAHRRPSTGWPCGVLCHRGPARRPGSAIGAR